MFERLPLTLPALKRPGAARLRRPGRLKPSLLLVIAGLIATGCNITAPATATLTPSPTLTASATWTASATASPTATATPAATLTATLTPTVTLTPTAIPTSTPTAIPSRTPEPVAAFLYDNSRLLEIPDSLRTGLDTPLVAFLNYNDRENTSPGTAAAPSNIVTLYYSFPTTRSGRIEVLQLRTDDTDAIFVAPRGNAFAYLYNDPEGVASGFWVSSVTLGITARVSSIRSLTQRGLYSPPSWSDDGKFLALSLATGYDLDIFSLNAETAMPTNLTNHGAYDWLPAWSPDGRYVAFLSDRATCPSWIPGDPNACVPGVNPPPISGQVYVLEIATGTVTAVTDQPVSDPPRWVNNRLLAFATLASPDDLLSQSRSLWLADVPDVIAGVGEARLVALRGSTDDRNNLAEAWSPDGSAVLFQDAENTLVLMQTDGTLIATSDEWLYPRYGVSAAWSPNSQRIALGGVGGQCPYGRTVINREFEALARALPPPSMCEPIWSPDGQYIAYTGIVPTTTGAIDGRVDVYISADNGSGATNLTADLRGQIRLLGWVGGTP